MQQGVEVKELNFKCNGCGATVEYEPGVKALKCPFCGAAQDVPHAPQPIVEHDFNELAPVPHTQGQGLGTSTRFFKCDRCGATSAIPDNQMTSKCEFCSSAVVVEVPPVQGMVMPESLVAFQIDKKRAGDLFKGWISGLWFRPSDLKTKANIATMNGYYVPHFTYDANAFSRWSGNAGHYYYVSVPYTHTVNGKRVSGTRQERRIRWEFRSGTHQAFYDDVLINASKGLPNEILNRVQPYDLKGLVRYTPQFLAGFRAEAYSLDPRDAWNTARAMMADRERAACSKLLDGDTQQGLVVATEMSNIKWKHLLLPAYVSSYNYGSKTYRFMVNGQTGKIHGEAPYDWVKIGATIGAIIGGIILAAWALGAF
jgi:DNA-directed RNA polymerase subunit RPC12/RpoP